MGPAERAPSETPPVTRPGPPPAFPRGGRGVRAPFSGKCSHGPPRGPPGRRENPCYLGSSGSRSPWPRRPLFVAPGAGAHRGERRGGGGPGGLPEYGGGGPPASGERANWRRDTRFTLTALSHSGSPRLSFSPSVPVSTRESAYSVEARVEAGTISTVLASTARAFLRGSGRDASFARF